MMPSGDAQGACRRARLPLSQPATSARWPRRPTSPRWWSRPCWCWRPRRRARTPPPRRCARRASWRPRPRAPGGAARPRGGARARPRWPWRRGADAGGLRAAVLDGAEAEAEAASAPRGAVLGLAGGGLGALLASSSGARRGTWGPRPRASTLLLARSTRSRRSASATERRSRAASALELTPIFFGIAAVRGGGGGRWRGVGLERRSDLGGELVCGFVGFPGPGGFVGLSSGFGARIVYACDQLTLYAWSRAGYHFSRSFPLNCIFFYFENLNCILSWASPSFGLYGSALWAMFICSSSPEIIHPI